VNLNLKGAMGSTSTAQSSDTVSTWTGGLIAAGGAISVLATGKLLQYVLYGRGQTLTAGGGWGSRAHQTTLPTSRVFSFFFNFLVSKVLRTFQKKKSNFFLIYT